MVHVGKVRFDTAENEPLKVHLIIQPWDLIFTEPPRPAGATGLGWRSVRAAPDATPAGLLVPPPLEPLFFWMNEKIVSDVCRNDEVSARVIQRCPYFRELVKVC